MDKDSPKNYPSPSDSRRSTCGETDVALTSETEEDGIKIIGEVTGFRKSSAGGVDSSTRVNSRPRTNPVLAVNAIYAKVINEIRDLKEATPFLYPVRRRDAPKYRTIVKTPMDLQTIKGKCVNGKYELRTDLLKDMEQMRENSKLFNGEESPITVTADQLVQQVKLKLFGEHEKELDQLEKLINPLLDDDQTALNYVLQFAVEKLSGMREAHPFLKPVSAKRVPRYHIIKKPMDFEKITQKIKAKEYKRTEEFMADVKLIYSNAEQFNGTESIFAKFGRKIVAEAEGFLERFDYYISGLEKNMKTEAGSQKNTDSTSSGSDSDSETTNDDETSSSSSDVAPVFYARPKRVGVRRLMPVPAAEAKQQLPRPGTSTAAESQIDILDDLALSESDDDEVVIVNEITEFQ